MGGVLLLKATVSRTNLMPELRAFLGEERDSWNGIRDPKSAEGCQNTMRESTRSNTLSPNVKTIQMMTYVLMRNQQNQSSVLNLVLQVARSISSLVRQ